MKNPVALLRDASVALVHRYIAARAATDVMESCTYSYKTDAVHETRLLSATPIGNGNYKVVEIKNTALLSAAGADETGEYADRQQFKTERGNMTLAGALAEMERYEAEEDHAGATPAFAEPPQSNDFIFSKTMPDNHYTEVARQLGVAPDAPSNENAPSLNGSLHA